MSWNFGYDKIAIVKVDRVDLHCDGEEPTVTGTLFDSMIFNDINEFRHYFNSPQWELDSNNRLQCRYDKYFREPPLLRTDYHAAIKDVIFNDPATIVFWSDGDKTIVKAADEKFDKEKGLAMAIAKKLYGYNKGNYYNIFKRYCGEESNDHCGKAERKLELQGDESAIEILSEMRSWFSCFDEKEGLAYDALSLAIKAVKANSNVARRETNDGKD